MPLPKPHKNEAEQDFVSRCIATVVGDGTVDNTEAGRAQAAAMCYDQWRNRNKPKQFRDTVMNRAYSFLEIKSINEDLRIIEGIASTPTADRIGDVVEPMGAKFNLPMPLLWQHRSDEPIGHVVSAKATDKGIPFTARIAKTDVPGKLKDRLDEAWQSIKLGLVRAVSIGFAPIKYSFLKDGSGMQFDQWEWLELSAVTIPANSEATINIIRSIDSETRKKATVPAPNPKENQGDYMDRCTTELTSNGVLASAASTTCSQMWDSMMGKSAGQFGPEVPGPEDGETAQEFMDRCQSTMSGSGLPADSIAMACGNMWDGAMMPSAEGSDQGDTASAPLKTVNLKIGDSVVKTKIIPPGDPGKTIKPVKTKGKKHMAKKTIAEQISAFENTRGAKDARMRALMDEASENDVTLDQEQQEEYDTLEGEVSQVDAHLVRLRKMAESNVQQAKPVEGQGSEQALVTRGAGIVSAVRSPVPPGIGFARMAICMMNAYKHHRDAALVARSFYPNNPEVELALSQKATAVDPGDTTTGNWAPALVLPQNLAGEFVEFLRPLTLIGRVPGFRTVPFNVKIPTQTGGTSGHWVGEGQPKPVGALSFDTITLRWSKVAGIVAFTDELARFSNPSVEALVRDDLARGLAQFLDEQFLDPSVIEVSNVSPASITNSAGNASASGATINDVILDVQAAFAAFQAAFIPITGSVWVMEPNQAVALSMMQNALGQSAFPGVNVNGGVLFGLPVYVTESVGSGQIVLFKPSEILLADDGAVAIDVSREASLQLSDSPSAGTATDVNLWQSNMVAVRAERYINWKRRRDDAVYYISGAAYGGAVTP